MNNNNDIITQLVSDDTYKYGFVSDIEHNYAPKGLNEDVIRFISSKMAIRSLFKMVENART